MPKAVAFPDGLHNAFLFAFFNALSFQIVLSSPMVLYARTLGASATVLGIIAGMILCFAKAMGEFGATITFVSNIPGETQTLPSAIYTFTQVPGGDMGAMRLTLISIVISMGALVVSELLARRVGHRLSIE